MTIQTQFLIKELVCVVHLFASPVIVHSQNMTDDTSFLSDRVGWRGEGEKHNGFDKGLGLSKNVPNDRYLYKGKYYEILTLTACLVLKIPPQRGDGEKREGVQISKNSTQNL